MNDTPRLKLHEIIKRYGITLINDPRRVRALLLDLCGQYRPEIFVIVQAQEESVAEDLLEVPDSVPLTMLISQLTHRLVENRALSPNAARWGVESWAYALDKPVVLTTQTAFPAESTLNTGGSSLTAQRQESNRITTSTPQRTDTSQDRYVTVNSQWAVDYYWRQPGNALNTWTLVGQTPGEVQLPTRGEFRLAPHLSGDDLKFWSSEFQQPKNVTQLVLDTPVSDNAFKILAAFPNIVDLTVDNCEFLTDQGFASIKSLPALEKVKLTWCSKVGDVGFANLAELKHLQDIKIEWAQITDSGLRAFADLPALSHLGLRECKQLRGDGVQYLTRNPSIQSVDFAGATGLSDSALQYIGAMTQLNKLDLFHCTNITGQGLSSLRQLKKLAYLSLGRTLALQDHDLALLAELSQLTSLSLSHTGIGNAGLGHLRKVHQLAYLDLSGCENITDRGLKYIQQMDNLTHVNISGCKRLSTRGISRLERPGLSILR